ncbi:MAG: HAMP domain-containing histidine kinase [Ruminococcaceae bacterium]|nr:HAMP domain-containing histidine kinase [Oscillospiraceae bacterium]
MKKLTLRSVLREFSSFLLFFLIVGFVVTCCMMLFLNVLADTMDLEYPPDNIEVAAKITFLNVLIIAVIFKTVDYIRRKIMVDRPVRIITDATEKITSGDFSARVESFHGSGMEGFNRVGEAINAMAAELSGVETLRTDFIANVSHEMKTPLAVMQNYGTLLRTPDLPEETRVEYAKAVTDASRRLSDMMTNILKLNRLENQQIYPNPTAFDLGEQLCECLLQYEGVWERKNIEIETDIAEEVTVTADAELLSLVWNNLFSNAFKFTEDGGKVTLTLTADDKYATVRVTDTGCGMTAEVGAHIFEKFYQGDTSRATQGNGLGLALVKRVIDILQGEIGVESAVGVGTTFTVRIRRGDYGLEEAR